MGRGSTCYEKWIPMTFLVRSEKIDNSPTLVALLPGNSILATLVSILLFTFAMAVNAQEVITNASVKSDRLSVSTLRAMFGMRLRNWSDGTPITVFILQAGSPDHIGFTKNVLKMFPHQLQRSWDRLVFSGTGQAPTVVRSLSEMKAKVASTPGAVGYIDRDNLDDTIKVLNIY